MTRPSAARASLGLLLISLAASLSLPACGARSGLLGASGPDVDSTDAGVEAAVEASADAPGDTVGDLVVAPDATPEPERCMIVPSGPQTIAYSLSTSEAYTPSLALLSAGEPASFAMQAVISGPGDTAIHWTGFSVDNAAWPDGLQQLSAVATITDQTFSYAHMVPASEDSALLALAWLGEEAGPLGIGFRTIDASAVTLSPIVSHPGFGGTPVELVSRIRPNQATSYLVAWHQGFEGNPPKTERAEAALLDSEGGIASEAVPVFEAVTYPAPSPALAWTGETFLAATAFESCAPADSLCAERAVVLSRLVQDDPSGSTHFEPVAVFPALDPGSRPSRPVFAIWETAVYVAWFEHGDGEPSKATLRVRELGADGSPAMAEAIVADQARPISSVDLSASNRGLVAHWFEDGDTSLAAGDPGFNRLVAIHLWPSTATAGALQVGESAEIPVSRYRTRGRPSSVVFASHKPAMLVAWSGWNGESSHDAVVMAGFDCVPLED